MPSCTSTASSFRHTRTRKAVHRPVLLPSACRTMGRGEIQNDTPPPMPEESSRIRAAPMTTHNERRKAAIIIGFGLFILWGFGWDTVGRRLQTNVDGIIVASRDVPPTRGSRYATEYTVRRGDGSEQVFWAGPTDGSLPRSMPVGTRIRKVRWELRYERDGKRESFPCIFYSVVLGIAVGLVVWGVLILCLRWK
jgi:hypothetical protein